MKRLISKLRSFPYYVFGVILFFLTHGYSENVGLLPFSGMIAFFFISAFISGLILWLLKQKMQSVLKAGIITGLMIFFYLFYGALQGALKSSGVLAVFSKYSIFLPLMVVLIFVAYFFIKRSSRKFEKTSLYLNVVLLVLIFADFALISVYFFKDKNLHEIKKEAILNNLSKCDTCSKPDIYLIVFDEYCGNNALEKYFGYNNNEFTLFLRQKGFYVAANPSSNYSSTPVSMASTLNMQYLSWLNGRQWVDATDYASGAKLINDNIVVDYLKFSGYQIKNYSIFDIDGSSAVFDVSNLPVKMKLITAKTLWERMKTDLLWNVRVGFANKHKWLAKILQGEYTNGNRKILYSINNEILNKAASHPRFVYTHFLMPHFPYIYDSSGIERYDHSFFNPGLSKEQNDSSYLQYLIYSNKVAEHIINNILRNGKANSVIVLLSDHGNRHFEFSNKSISVNNNFNAVFLPDKNYKLFYDSVSNVNEFRIIFNTLFNQRMPLLKDSVVF